ncbi:sensor histidine kinase [Paenibacillus sp. HN-1]|uniref:sensor histidine kinase n=1 Tax=Paenibacillus TaxID=44249 RepID=UPI001CA8ACCE|nr:MULTISPECIES: sensor histidine kinase [Paenibacillus]MBY9079888.1 sensor histidine kinase [Paenibacillus sp. CGMCC 1.18879]MBY9084529.1 sensor histidine kinase [Paenibacillus sinensis]
MKRYMPFTYKMMIPYLLLVLFTDAVIGYISYAMLVGTRTDMAETNIRTGMKQASSNIRYQMDEIQRMSDTLFGSLSFQRALQKKGTPYDIYLVMLDEIVPQITSPLKLFGNHIRLMLYTFNEDLNIVSGDNLDEQIKRSDYYILSYHDIENTTWYKNNKESEHDNIWLQIDTDRKLGNISHIRRLVSYSDYKTVIGYVRITASLSDLFGNFATFPVDQGVTVRLRKSDTDEVIFQRGDGKDNQVNDRFLTLQETIPDSGFYIEAVVPPSYLHKDAGKMQRIIFAVCAISFLVMACIGLLVARLSGRKMSRIVTLVRSFQEGNFQKRIRFSGNDEFRQIADAFNIMAKNIQDLISSVYVQDIKRKQAELEALQSQINPHFLYNTLSTISSLANLGETRKVTEMVQGLSRFYRLTLNRGHVEIEMEQELQQVETYLEIQKVKYADAFAVYVDVEPQIMQAVVIKVILQPFVENVFKHAWFDETIAIRISGRRVGDEIELKIIDNGIGMREDTVERIMAGKSETGGYGVKNVDERIKLKYGQGYGVTIASIYGAGTTVRIRLPYESAEDAARREEEAAYL